MRFAACGCVSRQVATWDSRTVLAQSVGRVPEVEEAKATAVDLKDIRGKGRVSSLPFFIIGCETRQPLEEQCSSRSG